MTEKKRVFIPKGGRCQSCIHLYESCSHLPFEKMPVILRDGDLFIVKCTEYQHETSK